MNKKPTIAAFIIFFLAITTAFFITASDNKSKDIDDEVQIFVVKQPVEVPSKILNNSSINYFKEFKSYVSTQINKNHSYLYRLVDSYEIEISDFWREVLNHFEIIEYYKGVPEAFIRRLILMPTFTGIKEVEPINIYQKPLTYPDYDYRSIKYRVSLVPNTISQIKEIIDYLFNRIKISLIVFLV